MTRHIVLPVVVCVSALAAVNARAGIVVFDNIDEFRAAAGPLVEIDFSVLPDGTPTPSSGQFPLTPDFNYSDWGVTFSSPRADLHVLGHPDGSSLVAISKSSLRNWIDVGLSPDVFAVAFKDASVFGPYLSIYDGDDMLLSEVRAMNGFIGIVSDVPIHLARIDDHSNVAAIGTLLFHPVPEPNTLALLIIGALGFAKRKKR